MVEIDTVLVELGGQELGEPHGAAPGGLEVLALVALLQHLHRQQEFVAEHVLALAHIGLGGEHAHRVVLLIGVAEVGLAAPDREQHWTRHTELLLDRIEGRGVLGAQLRALGGEAGHIRLFEIIGRGLDELGLPALRRLWPAWDREIGQLEIGLEALGRGVEGRPADPHRLRIRPRAGEPLLERGIGGEGRIRNA
jgi:hypothetical protein